MRLTPAQHQTERQVVAEFFGPDARLLLFGSRLDDARRGGDFDFYAEVSGLSEEEIVERTAKLRSRLFRSRAFAGRKVDPGGPQPRLRLSCGDLRRGHPGKG